MPDELTRRERQIMNALHRLKRATAAEIEGELEDAPSYSAVRAHLATMERKGLIQHEQDGQRYVYFAKAPVHQARKSALRQLVDTFFDGSAAMAAAALLDPKSARLSQEELDKLQALIEAARKEGR
ncbi:MAG: BlaI/MecI/CopY family transcriptional regulator [Bryobacter sp.]